MRSACLVVSVFIVAGVADCSFAQQPAAPSPDVQAIQKTARAFVDVYDAGNAAAIAELWTPDGEYVVGQTTLNGQSAIQKAYEEFFHAHPGSRMEVHIDSIKVLTPTVAVEQGTASVSGSPNGLPSASDYLAIHVKQDGKWRMASVRESDEPATPRRDLQELAWLVGDWTARGNAAQVDVKYEWMADQNYIRGETTVKANDAAAATPGGTQFIGKDPFTGQIVTWFFHADGGHGYGVWTKDGKRWLLLTTGATPDGVSTTATNVLYHADENVISWQSVNRTIGGQMLPNTKEIVIERVPANKPTGK
jgi:uncharacterized protein (TIGR02246 family)